MGQLTELQRFAPRKFRWEEVGFELDNIEKDLDEG